MKSQNFLMLGGCSLKNSFNLSTKHSKSILIQAYVSGRVREVFLICVGQKFSSQWAKKREENFIPLQKNIAFTRSFNAIFLDFWKFESLALQEVESEEIRKTYFFPGQKLECAISEQLLRFGLELNFQTYF